METFNEVKEWTKSYFQAFDNREADYYDKFFAPNVVFRAGNFEATTGVESLKNITESAFDISKSIHHNLLQIIISEGDAEADYVVAVDISVDYVLKNDKTLSLPCVVMLKVKDFQATEHKVFVDAKPLSEAFSA